MHTYRNRVTAILLDRLSALSIVYTAVGRRSVQLAVCTHTAGVPFIDAGARREIRPSVHPSTQARLQAAARRNGLFFFCAPVSSPVSDPVADISRIANPAVVPPTSCCAVFQLPGTPVLRTGRTLVCHVVFVVEQQRRGENYVQQAICRVEL